MGEEQGPHEEAEMEQLCLLEEAQGMHEGGLVVSPGLEIQPLQTAEADGVASVQPLQGKGIALEE